MSEVLVSALAFVWGFALFRVIDAAWGWLLSRRNR